MIEELNIKTELNLVKFDGRLILKGLSKSCQTFFYKSSRGVLRVYRGDWLLVKDNAVIFVLTEEQVGLINGNN